MRDRYGRNIDYMRISITDRCNLRCRYCMPKGVEYGRRWDILSLEEIRAVAFCGAKLGIRHIKITGGEPLVREGCCKLVKMLKETPGIEKVTITTNGILLNQYLESLLEAGIDGINISLDTLNRDLYRKITGQDQLMQVLEALKKAVYSQVPVKVNAVSADFGKLWETDGGQEGGDGWQTLAELAKDLSVDVRFIEMMPVGHGKDFDAIDHQRLLGELRKRYPGIKKDERIHGFGPAVYYQIPGFKGSVGLISAIHGKFCSQCNRVRLTAQGQLKSCLCYEDGVDLQAILRKGQARPEKDIHYRWDFKGFEEDQILEERLTKAIKQAILGKPEAHCFDKPESITERRGMSFIGG